MHTKDKDGNAVFAGKPRDLFTEANFRKFERGWDDGRVATAFFRGEKVRVVLMSIQAFMYTEYP